MPVLSPPEETVQGSPCGGPAGAVYNWRNLGSKRSRIQSPMKLSAITVMNIAMPGKTLIHQALVSQSEPPRESWRLHSLSP